MAKAAKKTSNTTKKQSTKDTDKTKKSEKTKKVQKTLYRLPKSGKIFGVCSGLAEYFEIDVTLMRIIFIVLLFATSGIIVLVYLLLALVMPTKGQKEESIDEKIEDLGKDLKNNNSIGRSRSWIGIILLIIGLWLLLGQFLPWMFSFRWEYVWPVLLILAGLLILARRK